MKLTKLFVGFFAVAAAMLTTSCLSSDEYSGEPIVTEGVTPTSASATVSAKDVAASGTTTVQTPEATVAKVAASTTLSAADVASLAEDATVTLSVSEDETAGTVAVSLISSDGSTANLPNGGVEVQLTGLEPNTEYTVNGNIVKTDAQGNVTVKVLAFSTPVTLTKVAAHSGGAGGN